MRASSFVAVGIAGALAIALLAGAAVPAPVFERVVFFPQPRLPLERWSTPPESDLAPITVRAADGVPLRGWIARGRPGAPWCIFFYGNAGSVPTSVGMLHWIRNNTGMTTVAVDYRGYAFSGGDAPNFRDVRADALRAYDAIAARSGTSGVFVYGLSLGSTLAVHVAAARSVRGMVLHSPVATAEEEAAWYRYHMVPAPFGRIVGFVPNAAVRAGMNNVAEIAHVHAPLLVVHGDADPMVPFEGGHHVFAAAASADKEFVQVRGAHHNDIGLYHTPAGEKITAFLLRLQRTAVRKVS